MNNFGEIKILVIGALAAAGAVAAEALGGWDVALKALLSFMAADYITGLIVAAVFRRSPKTQLGALSSRAGFVGLLRKCCILLVVLLAVVLDGMAGAVLSARGSACSLRQTRGCPYWKTWGLWACPIPGF